MSTTRALKRISAHCEDIKASITKFNNDTSVEVIETNIQLLEEEWKEYHELEKLIGDDVKHITLQDSVEESFFKIKKVLFLAKREREAEISRHVHNASIDELMVNQQSFLQEVSLLNKRDSEVRLPRINIPTFSGKYSEFPSFKDLFEASIDSNAKISKVHKFQYLKGLLTDEAAALVRHIAVTEANYKEAWEKIKERYDKKRLVVSTLIKQFVDQPIITKPSAKALHQMSDVSDEVLRGLKVLGAEAEKRDPWLIHILVNKLDGVTKQAWATETAEEDFPSMKRFFKFLNRRSDSLDTIDSNKSLSVTANNRVKNFHSASSEPVCVKCSKDHYLSKCEEFLSLSVNDRRGFVSNRKLCFNCLSPSHQAVICRSKYRCGKCHRKHHMTLHSEDGQRAGTNPILSSNPLNISEVNTSTNTQLYSAILPNFQSILPTAMVQVNDRFGNVINCRVLLDSGSQASFITEACMQRLKVSRTKANISVSGLTAGNIFTKGAASIKVKSLQSLNEIQIEVLIINQLPTKLPSIEYNLRDCDFLKELKLADPQYNKVAPVDILIGADRFFHIIRDGRMSNFNNSIIAQNTIFGWIVSGVPDSKSAERSDTAQANICTLNMHLDVDIDETLKRFFEQEEIPSDHFITPEEVECEERYKLTHKRTEGGRYMVEIPFNKSAVDQLGDSENAATRRFMALERKLQSNPALKVEYTKVISEYLKLGYMEQINDKHKQNKNYRCFYLPHHCVLKESSDTTKLRVVFDGSAKSSTGVSLNQTMLVGPTIQPTLWSTLMNFRKYKVALTGDVEKMYNQVLVAEKDTHFQRILWRNEPSSKLKHYKLNTVTFGLASSSFLAIRTLQQIGHDNQRDYPNITRHILENFYVDDFISGADTAEEVQQLKKDITEVLLSGGFNIRKWKSNDPTVRENSGQIASFDNSTETKILGLQWSAADDVFSFKLSLDDNAKATKRRIISEYSRVFDPLGWLSPSIVLMKIIFQNRWLLKLGWDEELPDKIAKVYKEIRGELKLLENIEIKRYIPQSANIELHGFSDASEKAYSAVVYCRTVDENGEVRVNLMASKTKVAPIKQVSLPRLELCGAYLLTKLLMLVKDTIERPVKYFAWTDSTIVLMWLSSHPVRWKTFVANRTSEILSKLPRKCWNHVRSEHNPADCASRGLLPSKLVNLKLWWHGPGWLQNANYNCTTEIEEITNMEQQSDLEERKSCKLFVLDVQQQENVITTIIERSSKYTKLLRVFAYVLRFVKNARLANGDRNFGFLSVDDLRESRNILIKHVQRESFESEIDCLQRKMDIKKSSNIVSLAPFIDANGILRVGGRLRHSDCTYDYKHPVILPKGHSFSHGIIWHIHKQNLHPGPSLTFHLTRQQYWIVGGRSSVRKIVNKCIVCFKSNARTSKQLMGDLPIARLKAARPFSSCGVDYAGPIQIASKKGRGARFIKGYIAIFVCMTTKAVHIELVSDLTTDAFIAALKRFVSRRGTPAHIYSDNGSNFVGAKRQLNEVYKQLSETNFNCIVAEHLSQSEVQWHFIPPVAPHFGGLWEAAVKSVKTHLVKCISNSHLTFEEMATLLHQIEAILNSRPLYAELDGDSSFEVLTPAHFLIGSANFYLPEEQISGDIPAGRLSRWQFIQQRAQSFWTKFSAEYLHNLQQRAKWQKVHENLKIGDVVILKEDNLPSYKWALGRILQLHPDDCGTVRVVTIKTSTSILKRPIVKICKLPEQTAASIKNPSSYKITTILQEQEHMIRECGQRLLKHKPLMTFAQPTYHGEYPWHVAIYRNYVYSCGGTILNRRTILTAGHCVQDERGVIPVNRLLVLAGTYTLIDYPIEAQHFIVQNITVHENYSRSALENDIALLKLSSSFKFTEYIQPICISNTLNYNNFTMGLVAEWGRDEYNQPSNKLLQATLPIQNSSECRQSNRNFFPQYLNENVYCANYGNGTNIYSGDSGSSMVLEFVSQFYIRGIVSLGVSLTNTDRCDITQLVLFTDVPKLYGWIMNNVDDNE